MAKEENKDNNSNDFNEELDNVDFMDLKRELDGDQIKKSAATSGATGAATDTPVTTTATAPEAAYTPMAMFGPNTPNTLNELTASEVDTLNRTLAQDLECEICLDPSVRCPESYKHLVGALYSRMANMCGLVVGTIELRENSESVGSDPTNTIDPQIDALLGEVGRIKEVIRKFGISNSSSNAKRRSDS